MGKREKRPKKEQSWMDFVSEFIARADGEKAALNWLLELKKRLRFNKGRQIITFLRSSVSVLCSSAFYP